MSFPRQIFEKKRLKNKFLMKTRPVGAELFHADRHDEAQSRFSQFWRKRLEIRLFERHKCAIPFGHSFLQDPSERGDTTTRDLPSNDTSRSAY